VCPRSHAPTRACSVNEALAQMTFSGKGRAGVFKHTIAKAAANADFYGNHHPADLMISEIVVGKQLAIPAQYMHSKGAFLCYLFACVCVRVCVCACICEHARQCLVQL
jgi:hypothetical protein